MSDLRIAANTFIWHSPLTTEILDSRLRQLAMWGFDAVELPLENVNDWDVDRCSALLSELGLESLIGAVFASGRELAGASAEVQQSTMQYMRSAIDIAQAQGSPMVIGPSYCSVGRTWRMSSDERRVLYAELRENYKELVDYAGPRGIKLAVEPLNRYETSVFNTTKQLLDFIEDFDASVVGLNLDTYHMNIEERSIGDAIRLAGSRLLHLQVCGNDRGAPGGDLTPWNEVFTALSEIGYSGILGIESFTADNASISTAASIWRPLADTQDSLAVDGLAFLRAFNPR